MVIKPDFWLSVRNFFPVCQTLSQNSNFNVTNRIMCILIFLIVFVDRRAHSECEDRGNQQAATVQSVTTQPTTSRQTVAFAVTSTVSVIKSEGEAYTSDFDTLENISYC